MKELIEKVEGRLPKEKSWCEILPNEEYSILNIKVKNTREESGFNECLLQVKGILNSLK